jgi:hypothetical protein
MHEEPGLCDVFMTDASLRPIYSHLLAVCEHGRVHTRTALSSELLLACCIACICPTMLVLQRALQVEQRMRKLPGLIEKLQRGVKVADVGCGCV